ncbi:DUF3098 domain-containing protein [Ferruginibacter albus]|uniref:DUF3098 domain-containing protein n=1 Tax=Ferruginibacter albus TaxID=2875540 RepID=UPI001CC39DA3|nr:DUF3098 domain-containing protein [Ferruginibacter albus]UAY51801.1 DUF3098 domain-containing protein [Ferruginibacter albus]
MATAKQKQVKQQPAKAESLFDKKNYQMMLIGVVVLALGFFLMAGGKSPDPTKFNDDEIYSTTRITIAPLLILTGFIIEIFAIMRKPKDA